MGVRLEHANLCVRDMEAIVRFLQTAFPEFQVRGEGMNNDGRRWAHVGTDETYIALSQAGVDPEKLWAPYQGLPGVNHLNAVRALEKAGFWILRQGKHIVVTDGSRVITVPRHNPVNAITMGNIVRDAGLTNDAFRRLL